MKNITFQLQDIKGTVLEENHLTINDNDTLLMIFDTSISIETANVVFAGINEALKADSPLIGYPKGIDLKVLKKN